MSSTNVIAARDALYVGDLAKAESHIGVPPAVDLEASVLRSEILLARGYTERALKLAAELLPRLERLPELRAQATFVAGAAALEMGQEDDGRERLERAAAAAREVGNWALLSRVQLQMLERSADCGEPYDSSLPLCAATIRAVHRAGDQRVLADAHVTFARLEARNGALDQASRHLRHVARILGDEGQSWVRASANLTEAIILSVQGDLHSAFRAAEMAAKQAAATGWVKGEAIAAANLAFFSAGLGDHRAAEIFLGRAEALGYSSPSFDYAIRDTRMALASANGDYAEAERLWVAGQQDLRGVASWYRLRNTHTRIRSLIQQERLNEALDVVRAGIIQAERAQNALFRYMFQLSEAEIHLARGTLDATPLDLPEPAASLLGIVAVRRRLQAAALIRSGEDRATYQFDAAERILSASGAQFEWQNVQQLQPNSRPEQAPSLSLDDAVALIELAGYPHVLARETYALLEISGAANAVALVARSEQGTRCVASTGWTEAEALNAAQQPGERLRIGCGVHRDEAWEVIADLRPSLNERCTGVAIRKLAETAVTLDRYRREEKQRAALWPADTLETDGGLWVSEQMTELLSIARRIAPSDITVLLTGETGTGKEVLARAIHRASGRAARPFVPFNCTAVPRELLDSQLFGYRKGAFTGANEAFDGVIRAAAGGTLFLDEIAEIPPDLQPKLLRFLETREVHALGESQPLKVDVRIIAATNADLEEMVGEGRFREDLFYRLNVVRLRVPPLRERREEIPPLIDHYLRAAAEEQKKGRLTLDDETLEYLVLYAWPGNVRQLVNEISRVVAYADADSTITPALLSPEIQASRKTVRVRPGEEPEIRVRLDQPLNDAVEAIERMMVVRALDRAHGNYENAAKLLGISRKGLFLKRRRWGMQRAAS